MECWNIGMLIKKMERYCCINFAIKMNIIIIPISHFPKTQYSNIPSFHYSNWGGAPKFKGIHLIDRTIKGFESQEKPAFRIAINALIFAC